MLIKVVTLVNKHLESATHLNKQYLGKGRCIIWSRGYITMRGLVLQDKIWRGSWTCSRQWVLMKITLLLTSSQLPIYKGRGTCIYSILYCVRVTRLSFVLWTGFQGIKRIYKRKFNILRKMKSA